MEVCSVDEILSLSERRSEIDGRLSGTYAEVEAAFREEGARTERARRYGSAMGELALGLSEIAKIARRAESECEAAISALDTGNYRTATGALDFLDTVNAEIHSSSVKDVAGFLFPPLAELEAELGPAGGDKLRRHLELSRRLYERISESADYHASIIAPRVRKD